MASRVHGRATADLTVGFSGQPRVWAPGAPEALLFLVVPAGEVPKPAELMHVPVLEWADAL